MTSYVTNIRLFEKAFNDADAAMNQTGKFSKFTSKPQNVATKHTILCSWREKLIQMMVFWFWVIQLCGSYLSNWYYKLKDAAIGFNLCCIEIVTKPRNNRAKWWLIFILCVNRHWDIFWIDAVQFSSKKSVDREMEIDEKRSK